MHPAVLFDIDGTLVDSNYLHVHAWQRAFLEVGIPVDSWRIHRSIGMDGSTLVSTLSDGASDDVASTIKELHTRYYHELTPLLRAFDGAREILEKVESLGMQTVLATSAPEDELAQLRSVLDREDVISAVTSSEDVSTAKPEPRIVQIALERAGVSPKRAVFVGDTVWDVEACNRAGLNCVGVLTGGVSRAELEDAGAIAVYTSVSELCANFSSSPLAHLK
ncbi:HAD family hydrolase [Hoyosella subflava]|uniref:HAD-superfamily hydrolase, subfamily IA, variant 3 n=1 Tax=Hoyosella subflava (strain DSM 45089 / JCM 17490 / NBRC 109087 / DQS3-9A1) TaxID=443218 RepID=F6EH33_HOYSD|nr:HAD family hydrolase [Hoyosella subflava]AEF39870.1 HAD-superfamily hydrolase, subfamily IA, variant 3 [Hoyosella subflava DQS3-9A1]